MAKTKDTKEFAEAWGHLLMVLSDIGMTKELLKKHSRKLPAIWDVLVKSGKIPV